MIEGHLSSNVFDYLGVDFWPYIRISLIARLKKQHNIAKKSHRMVYVLSQTIDTIKKILHNYFYRFLLDRAGNLPNQDYKVMLLAPYAHRFDKCALGYLNKHADSLRNSTQSPDKIGLIEYAFNFKSRKKRGSMSYLLGFLPEFLELKYRVLSVFGKAQASVSDEWQSGTDLINAVFKKQNINVSVQAGSLHLEVRRVLELATHCQVILRKFKVEHLINVVYCNYITIAFILAAKQLGIKTTEYQHGSQDETHPHYTKWSLIEKSGYTLLPENYWVWSKNTFAYMSQWVDKTSFHNVRLTGNFYISPYLSEVKQSHKKKVILLTLQEPSLFPSFMFEVIKQTSDEWEWWVREHPRFKMRASFWNKLVDLSNNHIVNVSDGHLYHLFPNVAVHMTGFSTCAFEAELFGVPTIFFDKHAEFGYQSLISRCKHLVYAPNAEQVLASIDDILDIPITPSGFIEEAKHSVDYFLARLK